MKGGVSRGSGESGGGCGGVDYRSGRRGRPRMVECGRESRSKSNQLTPEGSQPLLQLRRLTRPTRICEGKKTVTH